MLYLRARWYNPRDGRFLSQDPWPGSIYQPSSLHKYLYVSDDPVNRRDPSGRQSYVDPYGGSGCWTPPSQPGEPLTPREYVEKYESLADEHGRPLPYDEVYVRLNLVQHFKSNIIPERALLAMVALAESGIGDLEDIEYIMWIVRTRAMFNFWNAGTSYRAQILKEGQFESFEWIVVGGWARAPLNFCEAFDPKGGNVFSWYRTAYGLAGTVMAKPYEQMPFELRRLDSFANYSKNSGYMPLTTKHWYGDDFENYREGEKSFGDNRYWDKYEEFGRMPSE